MKTHDKCYRLGARLIGLAHTALAQVDVRQVARPALASLRDDTGETVHLAIRNLDELVYLDKIESRELVRMASTVGTRVPFHSSSVGKAYLAALSIDEAEQIMARLHFPALIANTSRGLEELREKVELTRERGHSFDDQENEDGTVCFGAAIQDGSGLPVASVSISIPVFRLNKDMSHYWRPLVERCAQISRGLGFA